VNIIQIASVISALCFLIFIVIASHRKFWAEVGLFSCLMVLSGIRNVPAPANIWVLGIASALAVAFGLVRIRQTWRDREWRASWKR
jgi:hypothetical protein